MTGTTIQGYQIKRKLGEGGMAEVYYAKNRLGLPAAVKVLKPELSAVESLRLRFDQEAHVMAKLSHPNIRRVLDITEHDGRPVILMEYLSGQDLGAYVREKGALSPEMGAQLWEQAASALQYAHSEGVIHRDVKPSNFFLTDEGILKLLDFGIAKAADQLVQTMTGQQMGTVLYMSPEQIKDPKRVTKATDYYSLGVTFYHLLTGKPPYDVTTESSFEIQTKIVQEELDLSKVPAAWRGGLASCLVKEPQSRQLYEQLSEFPAAGQVRTGPDQTLVESTAPAPTQSQKPVSDPLKPAREKSSSRSWLPPKPAKLTLQPKQAASGQWGYVDGEGAYVLPAVYDSAGAFEEGLAQVVQGDSVLQIDESGVVAELLSVGAGAQEMTGAPVVEAEPEAEAPQREEADNNEEEYKAIIASADRNFGRGNYERALGKYQSAVGLVDDDRAARAGIDKCEAKLGEQAEAAAWSEAKRRDTESSYESYLRDYPDGGHAREARRRLEELRKPALPAAIQALERNMVRVSGGSFTMGCTEEQGSDCYNWEKPAHRVELSSFSIGKFEVTQAQWEEVMGSNPSKFSGCKSCPVEQVSWNDVQDFIGKLNQMTGGNYRLPTEAEWEYAARGGQP